MLLLKSFLLNCYFPVIALIDFVPDNNLQNPINDNSTNPS